MIRRKWLSVCIALVLCLLLLPATALAAGEATTVYVGGKTLTGSADSPAYATTDATTGTVTTNGATAENYNIKWDGSTLTLRNATIEQAKEYGNSHESMAIYLASGNMNLALVGENTVDALGGGSAASCGINLGSGSLSISGEDGASLTVYGGPTEHGNSCGIYANGTITIDSGTVTATGESASAASYGIYARGAITINGGDVTATAGDAGGNSYGIHTAASSTSITVNGGTVTATSGEAEGDSCGIFAESQTGASDGSSVTIKSGTVTATAGDAVGGGWYSCGIRAEGTITVKDGTVNVKGGNAAGTGNQKYSSGLFANVNITVNDGTVIATGGEATGTVTQRYSTGLYAYRDITINSGTVTATAGNAVGTGTYSYSFGLCAKDNIIINSGTVTATAGNAGSGTNNYSSGFFAYDNLTISGGDVTGIGGTGEMSWGIACNDILTITGSTVVGKGGPLAGANIQYSGGINGMGEVKISGGTVTGTGGDTEAGDSFGICTGDTTSYNVVTVSIKNATVTATGGTAKNGDSSGISATNTKAYVKVTIEDATVTATGGSAGTGSYGIRAETTNAGKSADVTINGHSVVRLNTTGDHAETIHGTTVNRNSGIVFENGEGTVYGTVTLQEDLTVAAGETLTIPEDATLTIPDGTTLTNSGTITNKGTITNNGILTIAQGGTLTGEVTGNPVVYTVTVQTDGKGSASASATTAAAGTTVTLTAKPDSGYRLARWEVVEGDVTITGNRFIMPAENVTVRAVFSPVVNIPDTHEIELIVGEGGEAKLSLTNASEGSTITVTATPDEGFELDYITVDGERIDGTTFTMPEHDVTVRVYFTDGSATLPFTDVSTGAWYLDAVSYVYANGLMDGTSDTTFEPDANMTRAMVWAILARVDGETVTGANWTETAREWAMANDVSDGENASGYVTREQLAAMLWRYAGGKGYDVSIGEDTNILSYADFADLSEYAIPAMQWACGAGIITGVTDATLVPHGTATRAQCAAMLMRFLEANS